jgi:hypothetical protein
MMMEQLIGRANYIKLKTKRDSEKGPRNSLSDIGSNAS